MDTRRSYKNRNEAKVQGDAESRKHIRKAKEERMNDNLENEPNPESQRSTLQIKTMIKAEELEFAMKKLKLGKVTGGDRIAPEMVKYLNIKKKKVLLKIMNLAWETRNIPKGWKISVTISLFNKSFNGKCTNHGGISLLSVPRKETKRT
ncbi:hypothetical protein ILUMI_19315 [Ignelater luminosus]|uniref:Uncharacterized protein n=1 Tax=Ignelater luminosus TaxID=2038154 RepID=A0A8K0G3C1_IGNLU|nr:hypothetical protein ILUMI_19315 [Ignelater luminosus]